MVGDALGVLDEVDEGGAVADELNAAAVEVHLGKCARVESGEVGRLGVHLTKVELDDLVAGGRAGRENARGRRSGRATHKARVQDIDELEVAEAGAHHHAVARDGERRVDLVEYELQVVVLFCCCRTCGSSD